MTGAYDTRGSPFYSLIPAELAAFDIDDGWGESAFEGFLGDSFSSSYPNGSCDLLHAVPSSFVVVCDGIPLGTDGLQVQMSDDHACTRRPPAADTLRLLSVSNTSGCKARADQDGTRLGGRNSWRLKSSFTGISPVHWTPHVAHTPFLAIPGHIPRFNFYGSIPDLLADENIQDLPASNQQINLI